MVTCADYNKYILLFGRVLLVWVYINFIFDFNPLIGPVVPIEMAAGKGIPAFLVWIALTVKLIAGLAIIVGHQIRTAALALILFTLCTAFIFNFHSGIFLKEISMIGGLLILLATGPGELSLEGRNKSFG